MTIVKLQDKVTLRKVLVIIEMNEPHFRYYFLLFRCEDFSLIIKDLKDISTCKYLDSTLNIIKIIYIYI